MLCVESVFCFHTRADVNKVSTHTALYSFFDAYMADVVHSRLMVCGFKAEQNVTSKLQ